MGVTSPTQRTIRALKQDGSICAVVEKWNQFVGPHGIRQDLFGIIDILVLTPDRGILGIQACAGSGFSGHWKKLTIERSQETYDWLTTRKDCPGCGAPVMATSLEIWAWRKVKKGGRELWAPRVQAITIADLENPVVERKVKG